MEVKIFKLNDYDWVAATSLDEAKLCLSKLVHDGSIGEEFHDNYIDCPNELSEADLDRMQFVSDEHPENRSFREELKHNLSVGEEVPFFFASTEY